MIETLCTPQGSTRVFWALFALWAAAVLVEALFSL